MTSGSAALEDDRFHAAKSVRACELEGELVLLDIERGEYFGLGELGSKAWNGLARGRAPGEIARELVALYDVELPTLIRDLARFARELADAGLLLDGAP